MLGMMMDFLRDSIDPVFAKGMLTIYNSTTSVIMGIAAVVAIAQLFQENKDSENDKEEEKPLKRCAGELFLVVAIIFFCYGEYCKLHYYEVPNINFYDSYEKVENDAAERPDVLFMKGTIRREEARHACRYTGIKDDSHIHFLDLPFYETGLVKKNPISEADKDIIKNLLEELKPDQIFVAGDLADPHGTHKVCLDAILAAVDEIKDEDWLKACRIWMYRGAWAEWEMDHIEMAVPISPEELRHKRNAILKHQSQAESAPYLGDDERLFWQRAEDRNRATADLYRQLGLASYEAMEAFVQYIPLR